MISLISQYFITIDPYNITAIPLIHVKLLNLKLSFQFDIDKNLYFFPSTGLLRQLYVSYRPHTPQQATTQAHLTI